MAGLVLERFSLVWSAHLFVQHHGHDQDAGKAGHDGHAIQSGDDWCFDCSGSGGCSDADYPAAAQQYRERFFNFIDRGGEGG